jgi:hypothetical protein
MSDGQVTGIRTLVRTVTSRAGHFFFVFGYLWLLLSVYALHNSIVLSDWQLLGHLGPALLKALIFTKFLLIGEHLGLGEGFEERPLIWPILIKAALFSALLIGFDLLEEVIVNYFRPNAAKSNEGIELTNIRVIVSFSFMAFIALIPFFGIRELSKVIGEERMRELFFHRHKAIKPAQPNL